MNNAITRNAAVNLPAFSVGQQVSIVPTQVLVNGDPSARRFWIESGLLVNAHERKQFPRWKVQA